MEIKLNSKYEELWKSKNRYHVITGGRGSSKSFTIGTYLVDLAIREPGQTILFTRYTLNSAHISIIPEFIEKIELLGYSDKFNVNKTEIECINGSKIIFRGIKTSSGNQTANLKSIQGVTTWVLDEAEELVDEKIFDKIDDSIRTVTHQNRVFLVLNPTSFEHWIYKRFFEKKQINTTYIHTTYKDNIDNLSKSFIEKAENVKDLNFDVYKHRYLGEWIDKAEGVVFTNWSIGKFDESLQYVFGQDYGFSNDPTTLIKVAVDDRNKIIYLDELCYKKGLTTEQIYSINNHHALSEVIIGDSAEPRLISELKAKGLNIKEAEKGQGSISAGLSAMQDYKIIVTENSVNIQKELRNYVWLDSGSKLVIDDYNHAIDAARYAFWYLKMSKKRQTW